MDLISAAFFNFVMEKKNEAMYDYRKLAAHYDTTAVKYNDYQNGIFRTPEVLVQGDISRDKIKIAELPVNNDKFADNREIYNSNIDTSAAMEKVAVHDDSTGLLSTYKVMGKDEFITIEDSAD
jgi:hypothetical protein